MADIISFSLCVSHQNPKTLKWIVFKDNEKRHFVVLHGGLVGYVSSLKDDSRVSTFRSYFHGFNSLGYNVIIFMLIALIWKHEDVATKSSENHKPMITV